MITFTPIPREATSTKRKIPITKKKSINPFIITPLSHDNLSEQQIEENILHVRKLLSKLTQLKIQKQNSRVQEEIKKLQCKRIKKYQHKKLVKNK